VTGEDGSATVVITDVGQDGGSAVVVARFGDASAQAQVTFTLEPDNSTIQGAQLALVPEVASGNATISLTALLKDSNNAPLVDSLVFFSFADQNQESLTPGSVVTGEDGSATVVITDVGQDGGSAVVVARFGDASAQAQVTFTLEEIPVTPVASIEIISEHSVLQASSRSQITVHLKDEQGGLLANTAFQAQVSGQAWLDNVPASTDGNGYAVFEVEHGGAENVLLAVSSGEQIQTRALYFGASLSLVAASQSATGSVAFTALLRDANNAPLSGENIHFGFIGQSNDLLDPGFATTDNTGVVTVTVTDLGNDGGNITLYARSGQLQTQSSVQFFVALGEGNTLTASASAKLLRSDQSSTLTATVANQAGFAISNMPIQFFADGNLLGEISTDQNGQAQMQVSPVAQGNTIITLQAGSSSVQIPLYFGAQLSLSPNNSTGIADTTTSVNLLAALQDAQGVGIAGQKVNFSLGNQQSALLDKFQGISDEQGRVQLGVTGSQSEQATITASAGGLNPATATINFQTSSVPTVLHLSSMPSATQPLSLNGSAQIIAQVNDSQGQPLSGVRVQFSTSGIGVINESVTTDTQGRAIATFSAQTQSGISTITANVGEDNALTESITLTIQSDAAGLLELLSIQPETIGIVGSGSAQSAVIEFQVKDNLGNLAQDGVAVDFELSSASLAGDESLSTGGGIPPAACGSVGGTGKRVCGVTSNGKVSVSLKSGRVAGVAAIVARVRNTDISTLARVSIVGGIPDAQRFGIAAQYLNIAGGSTFGLEDLITVYVGDRFGNVVADGTRVNFISEGGTIGSSAGSNAFTSTTIMGRATAVLQSATPTTPQLDGINNTGNAAFNRIVAYTTGAEYFFDANGNGAYDLGEVFTDITEPYIDGNDNGVFDNGELYIDRDQNGFFTQGDGVYQDNTLIWTSMNIVFSDAFDIPNPPDDYKAIIVKDEGRIVNQEVPILVNKTKSFEVSVQTPYGNSPVKGTKITVTAEISRIGLGDSDTVVLDDVLGGTTNLEVADRQGVTPFNFSLTNPGVLKETPVIVTISVEGPIDGSIAPGSNGSEVAIVNAKLKPPQPPP
ncbi:Ig-like domain-containing protein, partial [Candidatus Venteria ishoeyi]|uniref:Ig-like domain-containing protein n=1 Tax=Candidatus Venteria ishoeyi TaxID=1899563 RepID=UPI0025A51CC6